MSEAVPPPAAGSSDAADERPPGGIWNFAQVTEGLRKGRVAKLRSHLADGTITRAEILEMLRLEHAQMQYYHTHYWGIFVKAVISVITMIALPYIVRVDTGGVSWINALFPSVAVWLCGFCVFALKIEEAKLNNHEVKIAALEETLDPNYCDIESREFTQVPIFKSGNKHQAANLVIWLFALPAAIGVLELVLILTHRLVF